MKLSFRKPAIWICLVAAAAQACSSAQKKPADTSTSAPPVPAGIRYIQPVSKTDPGVVEETDTYYVTRYKKSDVVKVDDEHIRLLNAKGMLRFFREDADYYYVRTEKLTQEEIAARAKKQEQERERREELRQGETNPAPGQESKSAPGMTEADFADLQPPRAAAGARFVRAGEGLPKSGEWRQNFAIADMNGDGIPDIVAPSPRHGDGRIRIFLGDGKGGFTQRPVELRDASGNPPRLHLDYGGVAVADFDGDGKPDVATASHAGGVHVLLQRDGNVFEVDDRGLPRSFSSQGIAAFDVDGDGRPDLVVSKDTTDFRGPEAIDRHLVKVFFNDLKGAGWRYDENALVGAFLSNVVAPLAFDGPRPGVLTGSNTAGALVLTWRNDGKGHFTSDQFDAIETYALHEAVATGTYGPDHAPAFAGLYYKMSGGRLGKAVGINIYCRRGKSWVRVPVWRQRGYPGRTTAVAFGDLNGDGLDDVVFPDRVARKLRIFYQGRDGSFQEAPEKSEPELDSPAVNIRLADLNRDGRLDIVLAKTVFSEQPRDPGGLEVLLNQGE